MQVVEICRKQFDFVFAIRSSAQKLYQLSSY